MTVKFPKSAIGNLDAFSIAVAEHADNMKSWRQHMAQVKRDEDAGVSGIEKHWPLKRPDAHPMVESAVNERDEADYEIVDDSPAPELVLKNKKLMLQQSLAVAEQEAIAKVMPPAKARLYAILERDIRAQDREIVKTTVEKSGIMEAIAQKVGLKKKFTGSDIAAAVNAGRTDEQQEHLASMKQKRLQLAAIERSAAQASAEIDDLTDETVDTWQLPDFSKII